MWQKLPAFIREWSILIVGILLIVPLLYFSSREASSSQSTANATSVSQNDESAAGQRGRRVGPARSQVHLPRQPRRKPRSGAPAQAPAMSHDRMAAVPAAQTSGQAAPAPTAAVAAVSGDVAAGKLVFRKCQACHSLEPGKNGLGSEPCRNRRQEGR